MTNPDSIDPAVHETTAVVDNGSFGTRTIRFETGRLARQAAGSVVAYLDDETMLLCATTASKHPKEHFDFFPLTVDVEERMYAIGKIPGSFFRREGRPGTDAILTCRLIDRPLRPSFVDGLRNEIQIVVTVMSLDPQDPYDALAINAASASTQLSGLPFSGPIGGVRVALIDGQWVAFPQYEDLQRAVFDMVVAGRVVGDDVAIMMVEAEATTETIELVAGGAQAPTEQVVAQGLEAAKPFIRTLCVAQQQLADAAAKPTGEFPTFPAYQPDVFDAVVRGGRRRPGPGPDHRRQVRARVAAGRGQGRRAGAARRAVRGPREGARRRLPLAEQEAGAPAHPARPGAHRRPRHHRHPAAVGRGRGRPAGPRLGAVRARRDPDHGRHHAEHAAHGAADRLARPGDAQALPAPLQLPAVLDR